MPKEKINGREPDFSGDDMQRERLGPRGVLSALSSFERDTNFGFDCTYRAHLSKPGVRCGQWALQDSVAGRVGEMIEITDFRKERRDRHVIGGINDISVRGIAKVCLRSCDPQRVSASGNSYFTALAAESSPSKDFAGSRVRSFSCEPEEKPAVLGQRMILTGTDLPAGTLLSSA
jgi:hypothetical protein